MLAPDCRGSAWRLSIGGGGTWLYCEYRLRHPVVLVIDRGGCLPFAGFSAALDEIALGRV